MKQRCDWGSDDPLMLEYHDREWGTPQHDDRALFEMLCLEGAQAGLSWLTILRKREGYRRAFDNFDLDRIAGYEEGKIEELLQDPGIVRNRLKIRAVVGNARSLLDVSRDFGSFDAYIWSFVDGRPLDGRRQGLEDTPAKTGESGAMSKDLLRRGFKFVGPTICYAFMQATGMVNDHVANCFRYRELAGDG